MSTLNENPPLQQIHDKLLKEKGVELWLKRDDLIHPEVSGNKWRKLKYNLQEARTGNHDTLLTFGGAYSNHIYAIAAAAGLFQFKSIGIIRGQEPPVKSDTLQFAASKGMKLIYINSVTYREKENPQMIAKLHEEFGEFYYIPEGGTNRLALQGVAEIVPQLNIQYDALCTACGTGGTLAGLVAGLGGNKTVIGFSALKGIDTLTQKVHSLTLEYCKQQFTNFQINFDYHFGGYARVNDELISFIKVFKQQHDIQLEPVYTGKMLYGIFDMARKNFFKRGTTIIALHTGGLQGLCGYKEYFS